jgi:hypothetical protein
MTQLEILMLISFGITLISVIGLYFVSYRNRDLLRLNKKYSEGWDESEEMNCILKDRITELEKKTKLSDDVLAVLNDMKKGGAVLEVTRVDRNDIFFHNGSQYR